MTEKLPYFPFYVGDWRKSTDVQSHPYHERGIWLELLCFMHESEDRGRLTQNGKALSDDAICRLLGLDKQVGSKAIASLLESGVAERCPDTGALMCRRMVREEKLRKTRSEAGKKGGNPALLNQNSKHQANQTTTKTLILKYEDDNALTLEGESEGKGIEPEEIIYDAYPLKVGKPRARQAIRAALAKVEFSKLLAVTRAYAIAVKGTATLIPHPATWFNQERFNDEPATWVRVEPVAARQTPAHPSGNGSQSVYSLQKQLEAVEREIKKIQNRGHEDPVSGLVIRPEDKPQYRDLKKRRDELNAQIAKGGAS